MIIALVVDTASSESLTSVILLVCGDVWDWRSHTRARARLTNVRCM